MTGIGLSLLVDRRFSDSKTVNAKEEAIRAGGEEIERLEFFQIASNMTTAFELLNGIGRYGIYAFDQIDSNSPD